MYNIAIIEDEKKLADSLMEGLIDEGYNTSVFYDAESAEKNLIDNKIKVDLIILDLMLPRKSGFEFCRDLRENNIAVPVLVLTALDTIKDKVEALDGGADDFMAKPFSLDELFARIRSTLRRPAILNNSTLRINDLVLNPESKIVLRGGKEVDLTLKEFKLLHYLMERVGKVIDRVELLSSVWGLEEDVQSGNFIDVHIRNLRSKIDDNYDKKIIRTVRGVGYSAQE